MEEKINIAKILKDKPNGIRLYSPIFGECSFSLVREETFCICVKKYNGEIAFFDSKGLYYNTGEVMLFPSKEMRDWRKFAWKKGDVLVNSSGFKLLFDRWANDDYTRFFGKFNILEDSFSYETEKYTLASKEGTLDNLEIEKPEFKDGDIVVTDAVPSMCYSKCIFILKGYLNKDESRANSYIFYNINNNHISFDVLDTAIRDSNIHLATDSEKQQLFDALAKEGKRWDAEKKMIVDFKPKVELKPFDKVLVRDNEDDIWEVSLFGYKDDELYYRCDNGITWIQCIPYDGNEHLLGTTNNVDG